MTIEAERLCATLLADEQFSPPSSHLHMSAYPRAAAFALLGQHSAALEAGFDRGYRIRWWYAFEVDRALELLHDDARFPALAARAAAERAMLSGMRERREAPVRSVQAGADADACWRARKR